MAGSQLKRLKASLLDQGIIGPQKSKKQKKQAAEEARANRAAGRGDKRLKKSAALETIREQFNPFQFKMNARGPKFPVTSLKLAQVPEGLRGIKGRPTVSLSRGEEKRRATLLMDMQRRNKVGGILDRRLGEGDPNMTPEERALERFAFEKQRIHNKKGAVFDLEDGDDGFLGGADDGGGLTHMGKSLSLGDWKGRRHLGSDDDEGDDDLGAHDDFDEDDLEGSDADEDPERAYKKKQLKRMREELFGDKEGGAAGGGGEDGAPERKKSKKEVMEEVITKSKYYKYERQLAKENDDDMRAELDNMLPELQQLLSTKPVKPTPQSKDVAPITGAPFDKDAFDKAYDVRLRQLIQDKKAEPSARTKTEEEIAEEQSAHLKKLEESRMRRMLGQIGYDESGNGSDEESDEADTSSGKNKADKDVPAVQIIRDDDYEEDEFNLGKGIKVKHTAAELGFDDEDDFLIDDDLVFSGSEVDVDEDDEDESGDEAGSRAEEEDEEEEEDEFIRGLLTEDEKKNAVFANAGKLTSTAPKGRDDDGVPYTFPCPQTHAELLDVLEDVPVAKLPVVVQRIRALYHPKLDHGNKDRLGRFAAALVEHIAHLANGEAPPYATIESLVRHIHSLAKAVPSEVAVAFRSHLAAMEGIVTDDAAPVTNGSRALALNSGDLAILTAAGSVFPTSDHFHQVVTPAMLAMARYLEQAPPRSLADYATGLYVCTLMCQYQRLSKRYMPELINYVLNTLLALAPEGSDALANPATGHIPVHAPARDVRIQKAQSLKTVRKLRISDCRPSDDDTEARKAALFSTALALLSDAATNLWAGKASLVETLEPCRAVLQHLRNTTACRSQLPAPLNKEVDRLAAQIDAAQRLAHLARRPLELHHHRPLAIRTFVPRFEDAFDPDKHYDPNRERAEAAKLQAEFKRERKGALRELRKDAHFMQREKLKMKKAKDAAYEKKYKRLVAEIQGSEGREANAYERERQARKRK
ncbi:nucleolar protein 14 [Sporothrix schenckii 1099-18]|uniref:Nucleolar protein 14 n=1 Tax=Sporothrix schenckii 1099-18 TaxID=1397361 RepID=A0A0F2MJI4_SPOSC|nr:nucleolar protein 14 [Sporothrix schenckii 1099-18]KJR89224.1 nucleolar protein 14 [Sporothrix schenckii 1099-18]